MGQILESRPIEEEIFEKFSGKYPNMRDISSHIVYHKGLKIMATFTADINGKSCMIKKLL